MGLVHLHLGQLQVMWQGPAGCIQGGDGQFNVIWHQRLADGLPQVVTDVLITDSLITDAVVTDVLIPGPSGAP